MDQKTRALKQIAYSYKEQGEILGTDTLGLSADLRGVRAVKLQQGR